MNAIFDMNQLNRMLEDFYTVTSIRITVFDQNMHELTAYPEHKTGICSLLSSCSQASAACAACDQESLQFVRGQKSPYTYTCHAGLTESIVPVYMNNQLVCYLFFGQIMCYSDREEALASIMKHCASYPVSPEKLKETSSMHPLRSRNYVSSATRLLAPIAKFLCQNRTITMRQQSVSAMLYSYLQENFTRQPSVRELCQRFQISRSTLYEIMARDYGCGPAQYIRSLQIQKAKELLTDRPDISVAETASLCGFEDYNYFITVFKKETGLSPKKYALSGSGNV